MIPSPRDTVVALSSAPGASARAVVRLSGARAHELLARVFAPAPPAPHPSGARRHDGALRLPGWPEAPATALTFRGPRSATGEDVAELWVPGAPPLVRRLLLVLEGAGARGAQPGELTRRAFLAGRLDLVQAEAVLALTTSEDAAAARAAARALAGGVGARVDAVKRALLDVSAHVEAAIDFSDDELDLAPGGALAARLLDARRELAALGATTARRPAGGAPVVALVGPANAGKSSLLNALAGRPAAIVSAVAGTTRDPVEVEVALGPRGVRLVDTAGEKPAAGHVEAEALAAADAAGRAADLALVLDPLDAPGSARPRWEALVALGARPLLVASKADLGPVDGGDPPWPGADAIAVSTRTGRGLDALRAAIAARLVVAPGAGSELLGTARQVALLARASDALERAADLLLGRDPARAELAAVDLALALEALGALTGEVTTDDMLDRLFGQFCVGK